MAFIYRAEKSPNVFPISSTSVGPGEYLDKSPKLSPRQNQEPFLSSANKFQEQINQTPGPGAYYKDTQQLNNLKKLEKSVHNENIDLVFARLKKDMITLQPGEKLGFDTKEKRFMIKSNNEFNKTPGPGQYFPSILNNVKKIKKNNNKNKPQKSKLTFLKSRPILSAEKSGFATVIIESKTSKENNKLKRTFQYDNFACRPKLFNIRKYKEIMDYNNNNENLSLSSTNYSDQKNKTMFNKFIGPPDNKGGYYTLKEMNNLINNGDNEGNKEIICLYKIKDSDNKNSMKYRINFCKKVNRKKVKTQFVDDIDKMLEGKTPGPGYYFDNIYNYELEPKIQRSKNSFSTVQRFHSLKKPWTHLGPGEYFNLDKNKLQKKRNKKALSNKDTIPFGSSEKRNNTFLALENTINNPGPGDYEIQPFTKDLEKDINSNEDLQFGFTGERFNDKYTMKDKYSSPGPGYYATKINLMNNNNNNNKINNNNYRILANPMKLNDRTKIKKIANIQKNRFLNGKFTSLEEFKFRDNVPPVGYYYPEYFSTIEHKNKVNLMMAKNYEICFNKSISKSLKKSDSAPNMIGPGYYNIEKQKKQNVNNNENHPPFFSSAEKKAELPKKKKYKMNLDELNKYYMNEYFKWNKKSFNVIFV